MGNQPLALRQALILAEQAYQLALANPHDVGGRTLFAHCVEQLDGVLSGRRHMTPSALDALLVGLQRDVANSLAAVRKS